ncbi:amidohydrolase/deacetylase family metallohydrolase [Paenibacillus pabuli]|uniref:amidohydrolase/deacetylase family metallohydrolase n=1 Tax=Paenibacillus pabuli TaxID=1472 RepID=UPI003CFA6A3E
MKNNFVLRHLKQIGGEMIDIVVNNGIITEITESGKGHAPVEWDGSGLYVSSGWIDMHVHAFQEFTPYGDEIDLIGVNQGVTTIVDAGSCGADRIFELAAHARQSKTRVFAFLNISTIGLQRIDELSSLTWINKEKVLQTLRQDEGFIVGLKARISSSVVGNQGIKPLEIALEMSDETGLPLMVHIGSAPPDIKEIVPLLRRKDIITHYLHGKNNNLFNESDEPLGILEEAIARGVHLDVGHGTASFSFRVAESAKKHGIHPDTISTDIYRGNRLNGPVYSMSCVLSKFLCLGYSLEDTIAAVTTSAARWLKRPELGRIQVGDPANLTLFSLSRNPLTFSDSQGQQRAADQIIRAEGVVTGGEFIKCEVRT